MNDDPDATPPTAQSRSRALRAKSDALVEKAAALQSRSLNLLQRIQRLDWSEVRVLNVEDHDGARFLRTRTLEKAGYTVVEATTAEQAIALGTSESLLKVALLDVGLPDGDGFKVCAQLKTHRPAVRVVMITSIYRAATSRYDGITAGADEYVLDPLPGHRLVRTLDRVLTDSPGLREAAVITTDRFGLITGLNATACQLLNLTGRHAIGRSLLTFVGADRDKALRSLYSAAAGQFVQDELVLRPRERKPLMVEVDLDGADRNSQTVEWTMRRVVGSGGADDLLAADVF